MNDLLERYLSAVCVYFSGNKKKRIYQELKEQILSQATQYDELEDLLVEYGHPRSIALSYGYRPIFFHVFNSKIVSKIERYVYSISFLYLFLSSLYYLEQLNCLPFQSSNQVSSTFSTSTILTWLLSNPMVIMGGIALISVLFLFFLDHKHPVSQEYDTSWNRKKLNALPHPSRYPNHMLETILMIIFGIFFIIYGLFFTNTIVLEVQHASSQMIHLMTYFYQPFIVIILLDYFIDMTKKLYTKKYLKYSSFISLFNVITLTTFIINSHYLENYLLPLNSSMIYLVIDVLIVGALSILYIISLCKLLRNIISYRSLFRK